MAREGMAEPLGIDEHLVCLHAPASYEAEQYRTLAHAIELTHKDFGLHVLVVTSPTAGDGKTTTAINLAGALAQSSQARVLLVCADLRKPTVIEQLGMQYPHLVGLTTAILNPEQTLTQVVKHLQRNLSVLPPGPCPDNPYEVLKSPRLGELLQEARQHYDYIVVDTPPLLLVPDCRVIGKWADGFLMVVAAHRTSRRLVEEALNLMDPSKLVGLVFNYDDRALPGYYNYYYYASGQLNANNGQSWWRRLATTLGRIFSR
jgi:capsular exopolysaccharide synthesis family protein